MKKILIWALIMFITFPYAVSAATIQLNATVDTEKVPFDVKLIDVNKILNTNMGRLDFQTVIKKAAGIDHWKLRVWCNNGVKLGYGKNSDNCGKAVDLTTEQIKTFTMYLTRPVNGKAEFSFKLKSYDKKGKWMHSDKESFQW